MKTKKKLSIDLRQCGLSARENVEEYLPGASSSRRKYRRHSYRRCNRVCLRRDFTQERAYLNDHDIGIHRAERTILSLNVIDLIALFVFLTELASDKLLQSIMFEIF